jgi:DNA polymerase-3 subunit delta'
MQFSAIIGHERPVRILKRAIARGTVAHAYLFSGEEGIGKKMTAFALAAAVNCPAPGEDGGCGACPSCRKVANAAHPDVHILAPDGDEIKIDQIRETQSELALRPFEGAKKVLIVDGAEKMNDAAANALLKTLEEPPGDAVIILVSSMPQALLPTIRSRCQEIRFLPLPRRVLARALVQRRGVSEEDAWFLAAIAQGSIGRGLEMDVEAERAQREEFLSLLSGLRTMGDGEVLSRAEAVGKDREQFDRLLDIGVERLRDMVVYQETGDERLLVYPQAGILGTGPEGRAPVRKVLADLELFVVSRNLLERRVSGQLVAENLFLKLGRG